MSFVTINLLIVKLLTINYDNLIFEISLVDYRS